MGKRLPLFIYTLFVFFFYFNLKADNSFFNAKYIKLGAYSSLNFINNQTDIPIFPTSSVCGNFSSGNALGYSFGLNVLYPIYKEVLFLEGRILYEHRPADLSLIKTEYQILNPAYNSYDNLKLKYAYEAYLDYLILDIGIRYKPLTEFDAFIRAGIDAGNPIIGTNYSISEAIDSPDNFVFPDGTAKHTINSGSINNAGTSLGASLGFIYEFKLDNGIYISPELSYRFAINSANSDYDWKSNMLKVALSAMWRIDFEKDNVSLDTITTIENQPIEIINKNEVDNDVFKLFELSPLSLIETTVTQTYPLLPYIFFEEKSNSIRDVYIQKYDSDFSEEKLPKETMDIYYNTLNIIGSRLKNNASYIEIRGTSDGKEAETKDERIKIARARAEAVANYFINTLKISKSRITITAADVPELETSTIYNEGYDENRRVELISKDIELFKPVIHKKFGEYRVESDSLQFKLTVDSSISNRQYQLLIHNDQDELYSENIIPAAGGLYSVIITKDLKTKLINNRQNIKVSIRLIDLDSKKANTKTVDLVWDKEINNYELGRLNLIVFDFDKFELNKINKDMISNFITNTIEDNSLVSIVGSTDKLGEEHYNQKLSEDRAINTANFIQKIKPKLSIKEIKGIGDTNLLYNNNLPEGRFYCRTVLIEVKTPINK